MLKNTCFFAQLKSHFKVKLACFEHERTCNCFGEMFISQFIIFSVPSQREEKWELRYAVFFAHVLLWKFVESNELVRFKISESEDAKADFLSLSIFAVTEGLTPCFWNKRTKVVFNWLARDNGRLLLFSNAHAQMPHICTSKNQLGDKWLQWLLR